jgi:hypothetical protein
MTRKQRAQRRWKDRNPNYWRNLMRRRREAEHPLLLGVRCDLRLLQRARAAAEFIWLCERPPER